MLTLGSVLVMEDPGSPRADEPPEGDNEGPGFEEMDPSGRYGRFNEILGRGACKVVYKAFDTQEGTEVAWNQMRISDLMATQDVNNEDRDRLFAEIRVLKALKHKNIMTFYDSWYDQDTLTVNFITELFTSGTLRQYRKRHKHVDDEVLKRWAWQILCGLVYLHGHNPPIIHRDLKCDNIFINGSDGVVKIGDLGLATMLRGRTTPQSVLGTPEFMAPELYEEEYDDRVDVYSFGMALLELATLEYPYSECSNAAQIYRKVSLGIRPQGLHKITSPELADFINVCIAHQRKQRPRARQLLKHPYFDSVRQTLAPCKSELTLGGGCVPDGDDVANTTAAALSTAVAAGAVVGAIATATTASMPLGISSQEKSFVVEESEDIKGGQVDGKDVQDVGEEKEHDGKDVGGGGGEQAVNDSSLTALSSRASSISLAPLGEVSEHAHDEGEGELPDPLPDGRVDEAAHVEGGNGTAVHQFGGSVTRTNSGSSGTSGCSGSEKTQSTEKGVCRCASTNRCFHVVGKVGAEGADKNENFLNLRLKITEPDGSSRTVEFQFDGTHDTANSVAAEMVKDLELSQHDADVIALAIMQEISSLSATLQGSASSCLEKAAAALQAGLKENARQKANGNTPPALGMAAPDAGAPNRPGVEERSLKKEEADAVHPSSAASVLRSMGSSSSIISDSSVMSAYSAQSMFSGVSVHSSPAQLGVANVANAVTQSATFNLTSHNISQHSVPGSQTRAQLSRTSSLEKAQHGQAGSKGPGSQSVFSPPSSGVMSPVSAPSVIDDKRSLSKVLETLQDFAQAQGPMRSPSRHPSPPKTLPASKSSPPSMFAAWCAGLTTDGGDLSLLQPSGNGNHCSESSLLLGINSGEDIETTTTAVVGTTGGMKKNDNGNGNGHISAPSVAVSKPTQSKEALRKQAADAMKAVELRSLTLLEGGLEGTKHSRGTPMALNAATRMANSVSCNSMYTELHGHSSAVVNNPNIKVPVPVAVPVPVPVPVPGRVPNSTAPAEDQIRTVKDE